MKTRVAIALVLLLAFAGAVRAQMSPRDLWSQVTSAARLGEYDVAKTSNNALITAGHGNGIRTFPLYSSTSASFARQAAKQGNRELATWAETTANQLDPRSPAVAFSEADRAADQSNFGRALKLVFSGFTRAFSNYRTNVLGRADIIYLAVAAIVITTLIFAIALFIRYGRSMGHDYRELLGTRLRGGSVTVLAFALLFLPIFLWLGPMWLVFYWFAILFGYADKSERVIVIILCLLIAVSPIALDFASHWVAAVDGPVMLAAISGVEESYHPEALRRLQEVVNVVPDNATLEMLMGNLHLFEGNDQDARVHYKHSLELRQSAGAHVNLGNLHFLNNDLAAAINEYQEAQQRDPKLAIAFYNNSVASGELYKFDEQIQMLEQARKIDSDSIERIRRVPPLQKVVMYRPTISEAWKVANSLESNAGVRGQFGAYALLNPVASALNPVTVGALFALALAFLIWNVRRRAGFAGACIKCGRTFCYRCKSARESATYCTQCIHIYLKRDGVSLETKRQKLEEVSDHLSGMIKRNRLFATFLPGSGQMLEGRTFSGVVGLFFFALVVVAAILAGHLAPALGPSANTAHMVVRILAIAVAVILWFVMTVPVYRRRTAG
ncbi:MAG TPA: tetratricopeptide repeat protein [Thermoanaerobaculia bacterium]|nr:tetratricopeptide repeat protein [Thermoanaerobaculia bacterium]